MLVVGLLPSCICGYQKLDLDVQWENVFTIMESDIANKSPKGLWKQPETA